MPNSDTLLSEVEEVDSPDAEGAEEGLVDAPDAAASAAALASASRFFFRANILMRTRKRESEKEVECEMGGT